MENKDNNKKNKIQILINLLNEINDLENQQRHSEHHTAWIFKVNEILEDIFGRDSDYYKSFRGLSWYFKGPATIGGISRRDEVMDPQRGIDRLDREAYIKDLGIAKGILRAAIDLLENKSLEDVYKGKNTGPEASMLLKIISIAEFKLRKTIRRIPEKEKEIQDAFESLIIGADIDYSREKDSIEYSSKTYIPDFTMMKANLAIEVKLCSNEKREKDIIAEINDDILAYKTKYGNIFFIVYDLSIIRDMDRFVKNFEESDGVVVKVVKH